MDSFLSESGRFPSLIKQQVLFSATNKIEGNAKIILEIRESKVIKWLLDEFENSPINYPAHISELHTPQPKQEYDDRQYQIDAVNEVEEKFKTHDRGQLIMACGTGKTFVTLWIKERLKAQSTLVLLPSLSLLGQTMREWTKNCSEPFEVLCVCSDSSVGKRDREEDMSVAEAPFKVTSEVKEISKFLLKSKPKVIFCTYQSSELVSQAQKQTRFDLIISDEAHRCVGSAEATFTRVLDKKAIKAEKRLFTTATPRVFSATVSKAAEERGDVMYGMDNIEAFGPEFYKYTFGQAIEDEWLSDYQVVIVGVNEPMVKELIDEREILSINPDQSTDAQTLGSKIGLIKSIKDYNLKRVISFHSRVASAKRFSSELSEIIDLVDAKSRPKGSIWTDHVSGKMSASVRSTKIKKLKELGSYDRGLLTNARCLSEGVDVPALDGVAFIDPKSSQVDIIQAVGRAIRLSTGKEKGTIILPVFIQDNENPDTAIDESNFKPIWDVLKALRAHDEILADELDEYRTSMGRKVIRNQRKASNKIIYDLPMSLGSNFSEAINTRLIEATTTSWEFWYGLLLDFYLEHGNSNVSNAYQVNNYYLGNWVSAQRQCKEEINKEKIDKLDELNFVWSAPEESWNLGYSHLKRYYYENGNCSVPQEFQINDYPLGSWVNTQVVRKKYLNAEQLLKLNTLGFIFERRSHNWNTAYNHLKLFYTKNGHIRISNDYVKNGINLSQWVETQRENKGRLTNEKIQKLNLLDFLWSPNKNKWDMSYYQLKKFKLENGHCHVPKDYKIDGLSLGTWVASQRKSQKKNILKPERLKKLNLINFIWDVINYEWNENYNYLKSYYAEKGHSQVPIKYKIKDCNLGSWVNNQRRNDSISQERIDKLNKLDFDWKS